MELQTEGVQVSRPAAPRRTHCKWGHELTPENVYWQSGSYRCRECHRRNKRVYKQRLNRARRFNGGIHPPSGSAVPLVRELFAIATERRISLARLAEKTGYDVDGMSKWRRGMYRPYINAVIDLANALGYDLVIVERPKQ